MTKAELRALARDAAEMIEDLKADTERLNKEADSLAARRIQEDTEAAQQRAQREQRDPFSAVVDHHVFVHDGVEPDYTRAVIPDPKRLAHDVLKQKAREPEAQPAKRVNPLEQAIKDLMGRGGDDER